MFLKEGSYSQQGYSCDGKTEISAAITSVSHYPSEIILINVNKFSHKLN